MANMDRNSVPSLTLSAAVIPLLLFAPSLAAQLPSPPSEAGRRG
jgi:hypothetical protein